MWRNITAADLDGVHSTGSDLEATHGMERKVVDMGTTGREARAPEETYQEPTSGGIVRLGEVRTH